MDKNYLYYGDNLDILRRYLKDETIDLVYLDPPFNSNQNYNVLFAEKDGSRSAAQIKAFGDTWRWDQEAARSYRDVVESGGRISESLQALRQLVGTSDMLAYLAMMAPRLVELHRCAKNNRKYLSPLHSTASQYLKILMDAIFGPTNFRNEIIWKRFNFHADAQLFGRVADRILFYTRTENYTFNQLLVPFSRLIKKASLPTFKNMDAVFVLIILIHLVVEALSSNFMV